MKKIRSIFSFLQRNKRPQKQKNLFQHTGRRVVPLSLRLGAAALALCLFAGIGLTAYPLMASAAQGQGWRGAVSLFLRPPLGAAGALPQACARWLPCLLFLPERPAEAVCRAWTFFPFFAIIFR